MKSLHPLCTIKSDDLKDNFIENSLSFTPNDCATLWDCIEDIYEEEEIIDGLSPDEYFTENKLLTLDDCLEYEKRMKRFLLDYRDDIKLKIY